jgi:hypothetical protein
MRPQRWFLPVFLTLLAHPVVGEEDDGRTLAFKRYRAESIRHVFASTVATSEERVISMRGLDKHGCPAAARWLVLEVLAKSDEGDVLREAARLLTGYRGSETTAELAKLWATKLKKNITARTLVTLAMGPKKNAESRALLRSAFKLGDSRIVAAACRAVGTGDDDTFKPQLVAALRHKEPLVRASAAIALSDLAEFDMMPVVFRMFCTDKSNFVRFRAWQALGRFEKNNRIPCETRMWAEWWERKKEAWDAEGAEGKSPWGESFPGGSSSVKASRWFGIPILADRVVFVLDATQRMDQGWKIDPVKERAKPAADRTPNFFSVKTRYSLSLAHFNRVLKEMPAKTQFALALYHDKAAPPNHSIVPESGKWLKVSKKTRSTLRAAANSYEPGGTSSLYEGLMAGFAFQASKRPVKLGAQVICFLTNGRPTGGEFKNRADRIKGEIWVAAQTRGVIVNAVGLHHHDFALLQDFAKASGGLYVHVQQEGDTVEPQDLNFWPDKKAAFNAGRSKKKKKRGGG